MSKRLINFWVIFIGIFVITYHQQVWATYVFSLSNHQSFSNNYLALNYSEIQEKAKQFTVLIEESFDKDEIFPIGSGVIIAREANYYDVLTVAHNFDDNKSDCLDDKDKIDNYVVTIYDGQSYAIENVQIFRAFDLAVFRFRSNNNYPLANFLDEQRNFNLRDDLMSFGSTIYVSGFPQSAEDLRVVSGKIKENFEPSPKDKEICFSGGYSLKYIADDINSIDYGMSGGPILNTNGDLIGIHGRTSELSTEIKLGIGIDVFWNVAPEELKNRIISSLELNKLPPIPLPIFEL